MMTLEEATYFLMSAIREELQDHAFGDCEVYWMKDGIEVAMGHFGGASDHMVIFEPETRFSGEDASKLRKLGIRGKIERNDTMGPNSYGQGSCVPNLTIEGVRQEVT